VAFSVFPGLSDVPAISRNALHGNGGRDDPDGRCDADMDETATLAAQYQGEGPRLVDALQDFGPPVSETSTARIVTIPT